MKKTETLFRTSSNFDKKSKLNKLSKKIGRDYLDQIENGVTIEQLDQMMESEKLPILKYGTQITIHGVFPELSNHYIHGYKNLIQNKNKSIGVKYNAIDEGKRVQMAKRLSCIGINYSRNSTDFQFRKTWRFTEEDEFKAKYKLAQNLASKIDDSLYYGSKHIWIAQQFGMTYIVFDWSVGSIYSKNIEPVLSSLGATKELLEQSIQAKELEAKERKERYERERKEQDEKCAQVLENAKPIFDQIQSLFSEQIKTKGIGTFLIVKLNYKDQIEFKIRLVYDIKGKKLPRYNDRVFYSLDEALDHKPEPSFSDSIFKGITKGWNIK
jgi:hypothetical protein